MTRRIPSAARTEFSFHGKNYCDRFAQTQDAVVLSCPSFSDRLKPIPARYDPQWKHRKSRDSIPTGIATPPTTLRWSETRASHKRGGLLDCSKRAAHPLVWRLPAHVWLVRISAAPIRSPAYLFRESPGWSAATRTPPTKLPPPETPIRSSPASAWYEAPAAWSRFTPLRLARRHTLSVCCVMSSG